MTEIASFFITQSDVPVNRPDQDFSIEELARLGD